MEKCFAWHCSKRASVTVRWTVHVFGVKQEKIGVFCQECADEAMKRKWLSPRLEK